MWLLLVAAATLAAASFAVLDSHGEWDASLKLVAMLCQQAVAAAAAAAAALVASSTHPLHSPAAHSQARSTLPTPCPQDCVLVELVVLELVLVEGLLARSQRVLRPPFPLCRSWLPALHPVSNLLCLVPLSPARLAAEAGSLLVALAAVAALAVRRALLACCTPWRVTRRGDLEPRRDKGCSSSLAVMVSQSRPWEDRDE